jgi:hypothetical protein
MKVMNTIKNIMNKEFEQWKESQLIEVVNVKMLPIQFVPISNLIQIKLMKVMNTMKNSMNKEFEQWKESQSIEVMNMKMPSIQFVSISNLIQMKLMKVIHNGKNNMNQEFQYPMGCQYVMILKNYGSMCDEQYQSEIHLKQQNIHFHFQLK